MKKTTTFGSLDLPGQWSDESTFAFVHEAEVAAPLLSGRPGEVLPMRSSIALRRIAAEGLSLPEIVALQIGELRRKGAEVTLGDEARWVHPVYGEVPTTSLDLTIADFRARQISVFVPWGDRKAFSMLAFSSPIVAFEQARPVFAAAFASFRLPA